MKNRLAICIFALSIGSASATTHIATSADYSVVNALVQSSAVVNGDTVRVPSGTVTWANTLVITKAISLIGDGTNSTIINSSGTVLSVELPNTNSTALTRISGFRFNFGSQQYPFEMSYYPNLKIRVDHCYFNKGRQVILCRNQAYGVVDHCTFLNGEQEINPWHNKAINFPGSLDIGGPSWTWGIYPGTSNTMTIEDCVFIHDGNYSFTDQETLYGQDGARCTFRYNTVNSSGISVDAHGHFHDNDYQHRGTVLYEIYLNTFVYGSRVMNLRGGTHLVWSNTFTLGGSYIQLKNEDYSTYGIYNAQDELTNCFFWGNSFGGSIPASQNVVIENDLEHTATSPPNPTRDSSLFVHVGTNYFLHPPNSTNNFYSYTPLAYPHPLVTPETPSTNPPAISVQPVASLVVNVSQPIQLDVTLTNSATPLAYQWRTNTVAIPGATNQSFVKIATTNDAGTYSVVITNLYGSVTSSNSVVTVSNMVLTTQSIANADLITIPAVGTGPGTASLYPSTIIVSDLGGYITNLTVTLSGLSHQHASDIDILLVGPTGQQVKLMSDAVKVAIVDVTLTFSNSASALPANGSVSSGVYRPTDFDPPLPADPNDIFLSPAPRGPYNNLNLSNFNGSLPGGTWSLYVMDDGGNDVGSIANGWSLTISTLGTNTPAAGLVISTNILHFANGIEPENYLLGVIAGFSDRDTNTFYITNAGTTTLTVPRPVMSGRFLLQANKPWSNLAGLQTIDLGAGEWTNVPIVFHPDLLSVALPANYTGSVTFTNGQIVTLDPFIVRYSTNTPWISFATNAAIVDGFTLQGTAISSDIELPLFNAEKCALAYLGFMLTNRSIVSFTALVKATNSTANVFVVEIDGEPVYPYSVWDLTSTSANFGYFDTQTLNLRGVGSATVPDQPANPWVLAAGTHYVKIYGMTAGSKINNLTANVTPIIPEIQVSGGAALSGGGSFQ